MKKPKPRKPGRKRPPKPQQLPRVREVARPRAHPSATDISALAVMIGAMERRH